MSPMVAVIAFGYSSYFAGVQRIEVFPMSIVGARLALLVSLVPFLFVEMFRSAHRPVTFFSAGGCQPLTSLKLIMLSTSGHVLSYAAIIIAVVLPLIVRLYDVPREAVIHLATDLTYVLLFRVVSVLVAIIESGYNKLIAFSTTVVLLGLPAGQTTALGFWAYADVVAIFLNVTSLLGCWHAITRFDPVVIQDHLSRRLVTRLRSPRLLANVMRGLPVEAKIYTHCFLMTIHGLVHLVMAMASFGYLFVAAIVGIPEEQSTATAIILTSGGVILLSAVLVECFNNINLGFARMSPVRFGRLTALTLAPHWTLLCFVAGASSMPVLLTAWDVTTVLVIASQIAFVPFVAWCSAMRYVGRRVLGGLQFSTIVVLALVAAVAAPPWIYGVGIVVIGGVLYTGAVRRYESTIVDDADG